MDLQPVTRRSVSDAVFDQLQARIVSGGFAPGDALPAERSLTEALGVNRQAVREALKRLHQAGLVDITHGGATRVRDWRTGAGLDLLPALLTTDDGQLDIGVARSILEMRACIGPDAARLCAERAVRGRADDLVSTTEAMAAVLDGTAGGEATETDLADLADLADLDWRFWELVIDGADNVAYRLAFNSLRAGVAPLADVLPSLQRDELTDLEAHRALAAAVAHADGAAAEAAAHRLLAKGSAAVVSLLTADPASATPDPEEDGR